MRVFRAFLRRYEPFFFEKKRKKRNSDIVGLGLGRRRRRRRLRRLGKKQVGPFVAAYLGCLARHLRRFAARRGAGGASSGYGGTPSSIADALSAALVAATRASPSLGAGTSASPMSPLAGVFGGGGAAAEEEASTCAEWLETTCRVGQIPRRALYAHAPPYVLDNASTRVLEE
jgi:hypothetical protein